MSPEDPRHGTYAGAVAHWLENHEKPCEDCAREEWRYRKRRKLRHLAGDAPMVPSIGTVRRIQALQALGWTGPQIADAAGMSLNSMRSMQYHGAATVRTSTAKKIAAAFDTMCMTRPEGHYANRARSMAARRGWLPPLAFDDIDDPNEQPKHNAKGTGNPTELQRAVDMAVVWRLVDRGVRVRKLSNAEAEAACQILYARGFTGRQIAQQYGLAAERYPRRVA